MKKIAAVDLGTNTFLCLIAQVDGNKLKVIEDVARVVRLGEKINENKKFIPAALARAAEALDEFQSVIRKHGVDHVVATATSAARDVENGSELLELGRVRNIPISIISGQREAELSFEGAVSSLPDSSKKNIFVIDVGGGSTELIFKSANETKIKAHSFNVGCVRLTEMFLKKDPVDQDELKELSRFALETLKKFGSCDPDVIIAVAGTPTTLAAVAQKIDFDEGKVEGYMLTRNNINKLVNELGALTLSERKKIKGLEPLRADVIVAGGALLICALDVVNQEAMQVSTRGLRYGSALHYKEFL